jgi:hypothetical protein
VEFFDIGAVVYFLRKVIWTVPDFSVDRYRAQLRYLHRRIEDDGSFVSHTSRVLVEARRPAQRWSSVLRRPITELVKVGCPQGGPSSTDPVRAVRAPGWATRLAGMSLFRRIAQRAKVVCGALDRGMTTAEYAVGTVAPVGLCSRQCAPTARGQGREWADAGPDGDDFSKARGRARRAL